MQIGDKIEGEVEVTRILYPKGLEANGTGYKIMGVKPISLDKSVPLHPAFGNFTIKGIAPKINYGEHYKVILLVTGYDETYGFQYEILYFGKQVDFQDKNAQRIFLSTLLTETQFENLYEALEDPFEAVANENYEELKKVKGFGDKTISLLIDKYKENVDYSYAFVELSEYDLTTTMVAKIVDEYGSPQIAVDKVKENPYVLASEVSGIGFKKADEIALKGGMPRNSQRRIEGYIQHLLKDVSSQGFSWVHKQFLFSSIFDTLGLDRNDEENKLQIGGAMTNLIDRGVLWHSEDKTQIGLAKVREIEETLAIHLKRLLNAPKHPIREDWREKIANLEKAQGWEFTNQQVEGIYTALEENVVFITGLGGCVDKDTEYFNGEEWKKISEYKHGEQVLQYNEDRSATLVVPKRYIKEKEDIFYEIKSASNHINQRLSIEHNMVYETSKGNLAKKPFVEFLEMHEKTKHGFNGKFLTTFCYGGDGINLSNEELKLMVAVFADGYFKSHTDYCVFNLKKERKIKRLKILLKEAGIPFNETFSKTDGMTRINFHAPLRLKEYPKEWYKGTNEQLQIIAEESLNWDGCRNVGGRLSYSTTVKSDADFIQFAFSSIGKRATISTYDRVGEQRGDYTRKSIEYTVQITQRSPKVSLVAKTPEEKVEIPKVSSEDGYKYCFEVPSGMLVLRRDDRIFVTGNSGKTSIVGGLLEVLDNKTFIQMALSGKAGARLGEVTGVDGYTIHRGLGFNPRTGWGYDLFNPMEHNIIIVDELSMVGADIMLKLVRAILTGSKLIMLADTGQLESIGMGNIAHDIMNSGVIPVVNLTEVHRQAKKSRIKMGSIGVRQGINLSEKPERVVQGDLELISLDDDESEDIQKEIIQSFKKQYELSDNKPMDVQVVVPMRTRGEISTKSLNEKLREICNPQSTNEDKEGFDIAEEKEEYDIKIAKGEVLTLRVGDKVINNKNLYEVFDLDGMVCPVYNGDTGILIDITNGGLVIDFIRNGIVVIPFDKARHIELAYALTAHKCVVGDTLIDTHKGKKRLIELDNGAKVGELKPIEGDIRVFNGYHYEKPKSFYNNGLGAIREIKTKEGIKAKMSTGHRVPVLTKQGEVVTKLAMELRKGDLLLLGREIRQITYEEMNLSNLFPSARVNVYLTPSLSRFLGTIANNSKIVDNKISLELDLENRTFFQQEYGKLTGEELKIEGDMVTLNEEITKGVLEIFNGTFEVIPTCIFSSGEDCTREFVKGLSYNAFIDYDEIIGKVSKVVLEFNSSSLAQDVAQVMITRGFIPKIEENTIVLIGKKIKNYHNGYGYIKESNRVLLNSLIGKNYLRSEASGNIRREAYKHLVGRILRTNNIDLDYYLSNDLKARVKEESKPVATMRIETLRELYTELKVYPMKIDRDLGIMIMLATNYSVVEIESITEGVEETYCLEMEEVDMFTQNSLLMHNCQGSEAKRVVVGLDYGAYKMLSKEWVYTAMTRAREYCVMVTQLRALKTAIGTSRVTKKQTFLKDLLREEHNEEDVKKLYEVKPPRIGDKGRAKYIKEDMELW